jgi:hypothetical protein
MSWTRYTQTKVLNHIFGGAAFTKPAGLYVALFTAAPSDDGGGTEVSGGAYARVALPSQTVTAGAGANPSTSVNPADLLFPTATADWGTVTHAAVFDAATGGNMIDWAPCATSKIVQQGDAYRFPAGTFVNQLG